MSPDGTIHGLIPLVYAAGHSAKAGPSLVPACYKPVTSQGIACYYEWHSLCHRSNTLSPRYQQACGWLGGRMRGDFGLAAVGGSRLRLVQNRS